MSSQSESLASWASARWPDDRRLHRSAHGVRKIAARRTANNGGTVAELEANFGWYGGSTAAHCTREANRVRLAKDAMHKLTKEEASPAPFVHGPQLERKSSD